MFFGTEAKGQNLCQCPGHITIGIHHVDDKVIVTEFPHHLTAHAAGRKLAFDDTVFAAADGDGHEIPVAVVDRLEKGGALGAVGRAVGRIFDITALVDRSVCTQQRSANFVA